MKFNDLIIRAVNKEKVERTPIWLMRQAGRYMKEYRDIRSKTSFLEVCKTPELACEVTLQPIRTFGFDAGILFSDILIPIEPMGVNLTFNPAPKISNPIRSLADVDNLKRVKPKEELKFVAKAIDLLVKELNIPLIGFAGAPFTLACYMVEGAGSKSFIELRKLMLNDTQAYRKLMDRLTELTIDYLQMQIDHGCKIVQLFDTWAGILPELEYKESVFPYIKTIASELKGANIIYFAKDGATYFNTIKELNVDGIGVDWKISLSEADKLLGNKFTLQGNLDPAILFTSKKSIERYATIALEEGRKLKGHIFNLGHGIMPETPVDNVKYLTELVKGF